MASIRKIDHERDADEVVELVRLANPLLLIDREEWLHRQAQTPERVRLQHLVAEEGGRVVGEAQASYGFFGSEPHAWIMLRVLPAYRRRGIGSALYDAAAAHAATLDVRDVLTIFDENEAGVAFALARGFEPVRAEVWSTIDPRTVADDLPVSVELTSARDLDPRELHRIDEEATRDMPGHVQVNEIPYEEWLGFVWEHPFFSRDGSFCAVVDGEPAAVSFLLADPATGRATNMFTGTSPRFRGRGLALAVKLASTRWAAEHGITQIATVNDETNAPMLAVNRKLGYLPSVRRVEYLTERERLLRQGGEDL